MKKKIENTLEFIATDMRLLQLAIEYCKERKPEETVTEASSPQVEEDKEILAIPIS